MMLLATASFSSRSALPNACSFAITKIAARIARDHSSSGKRKSFTPRS
jgi:hypothetical protein